jgi:MFS family permease
MMISSFLSIGKQMASDFGSRIGALRRPMYRRYWLGSFASIGATQLLTMGQGWLVYELSGSALQLGYLGASASIPTIIVSLFGGAIADKLDKRVIIMVTSLVTAGLLLLLAILDLTETVEVWHVLTIAALQALISGLEWPTRQAFFPALIEREDMMSAVALNSIIWQSCRMVMPAIGGVIIALTDTWVVFMLCSVGFFAMFCVILSLKVKLPKGQPGSTISQVIEGIRFIAGNQLFAILIPLSFVSMFFGTSYMQLLPAFSELLGADEAGYGYLISATGIGSVSGTLIIGFFQHSRRLGVIMLSSAGLAASILYLFASITAMAASLNNAYYLAMLAMYCVAVLSSMYLITSMTVLQLHVPDELRGRVMGIHSITYSLMPLGGLLGGAIASVSSPPTAVAAGATVYLAVVVVIAASRPLIRRFDGQQLSA